jgi:hypothetical protein
VIQRKAAEPWRQDVDRLIREAIANGTHGEPSPVVCQDCGNYTPGFFHKTLDGKMVGECCTPAAELKRVRETAAAALKRREGGGR